MIFVTYMYMASLSSVLLIILYLYNQEIKGIGALHCDFIVKLGLQVGLQKLCFFDIPKTLMLFNTLLTNALQEVKLPKQAFLILLQFEKMGKA